MPSAQIKVYAIVNLGLVNVFLDMREWLVKEVSVRIIAMIEGRVCQKNTLLLNLVEHIQPHGTL